MEHGPSLDKNHDERPKRIGCTSAEVPGTEEHQHRLDAIHDFEWCIEERIGQAALSGAEGDEALTAFIEFMERDDYHQ